MISSVRLDGSTACVAIPGATNSEVFRTYVREILLPTLSAGDTVVMDNLSAHKNAETIAMIEDSGAEVLFLPPYSPDFNPIEMMWSKVKNSIRAQQPRDEQELITAIGNASTASPPKTPSDGSVTVDTTLFSPL
jgi:transposase